VPIEPGAIDPALRIEEPVFRIRVAIEAVAPQIRSAESRLVRA
jgi:hypothetical protein